MKNTIIFFIILGSLLGKGCCHIDTSSSKKRSHTSKNKHWSYHGETSPEHWEEVEKGADCGGRYQSPINIVAAIDDSSLQPIEFHYDDDTDIDAVVNNGHSIQYDFEKGDYIQIDTIRYELLQFHFHEPAEHTIQGIRYPMVIHFVHRSEEGAYAVIAVMVKEGESSPAFEFLENYLPVREGERKEIDTSFDINSALPQQTNYYHYTGSLTTPPCTEGVQWYIMEEPITISVAQVVALQKLMPLHNYRNEQQLNGRTIRHSF
ncbi:carbonic anhydrase family protein [Aquimarina sp. TRL1]|uniref:carbonic anhydrase n=1 Tax=Aquimarina sp. (strain TRL1) TaxID=2736252 RepID=UPI00158872F2|nr:carbonic anhydrase family protein [Aquimarina sp. TRL1]QKX06073.1 carbonic anhydrase family protein [Aquimarina sp. TRL1]